MQTDKHNRRLHANQPIEQFLIGATAHVEIYSFTTRRTS